MNRNRALSYWLLVGVALFACNGSDDQLRGRHNDGTNDPDGGDGGVDPGTGAPTCTEFGKEWTGFAGTHLAATRVDGNIGADRARIKPYSALEAEYTRTIGEAPSSLSATESSLEQSPERFYVEPQASAIGVWSNFRVAFDGCLTFTNTAGEYAAAPTAETAAAACTTLARKFWSRAPSPDEVQACTQAALVDSASEATPRRRWAYTCASLLSSAGFLTY